MALDGSRWESLRADINAQLAGLLTEGFLRDTPEDWLTQFPRYVKAVRIRLERLSGQVAKDRQYTSLLEQLTKPLADLLRERPRLIVESPDVIAYRWMLEEFRVSLFAQSLGTRQAVSEKRLRLRWQAVDDWAGKNPN
jgi:ATP-dependent helicase HrpA